MKLQIRKKYLDILISKNHNIKLDYWQKQEVSDRMMEIDISKWENTTVQALRGIAEKNTEDATCKTIVRHIEVYEQLRVNPAGVKIGKLIHAEKPIKDYIFATEHHWLFRQHDDKNMYPYYVSSVSYYPPSKYSSAHIKIDCYYLQSSKTQSTSINLTAVDVRGRTIKEIFESKNWYIENESIFKEYEKELALYQKYSPMVGEQFIGSNIGYANKGKNYYRWSEKMSLNKDGINAKLVIDTDFSKEVKDYSSLYYIKEEDTDDEDGESQSKNKKSKKDKEDETPFVPMLPIHLFIDCFHLQEHTDIYVHVNNITPYIYNEKVADKLVLPAETKDLIDIMLNGTKDLLEDIVTGKKGGIIVLATGEAGVGKTLTAEVYSEIIKRPLYVVPSHQLGIGIGELEKNLQAILNRASKWKAILLIDEADVYIHERGDDIEQNAIVGIFLRVLEYYNGILFMTSNRATVIDDAILSRATAHIRYEKPTGDELKRIWKVLSEQFQVKMSDSLISECTKELSGMSGRDVKNLLKLTRLLSIRREKPVDLEMLKFASKFQDFQTKK